MRHLLSMPGTGGCPANSAMLKGRRGVVAVEALIERANATESMFGLCFPAVSPIILAAGGIEIRKRMPPCPSAHGRIPGAVATALSVL